MASILRMAESAGAPVQSGTASGPVSSGAGEIPIANIYYLLCYAWDVLEEKDTLADVDAFERALAPLLPGADDYYTFQDDHHD